MALLYRVTKAASRTGQGRRSVGQSFRQQARLLASGHLEGLASCLETPESMSTAHVVQEQHSHDESYHPSALPDAVIWPTSVEEVSRVVRYCNQHTIPVLPFGTGTGLEGGVTAVQGGIVLNLTKMAQIVEVNADDADCLVEPGVTRTMLNTHLRDTGLWFPVDPGADASLCGMAATSASGTNAVRYGTMRENVVNLEVVLPNGDIVHTAGPKARARKTSAGYNLTNLLVGSEGTLGVITKARLRLHGQPAHVTSAVCSFASVHDAAAAAMETMMYNIPIARMELLDSMAIRATNAHDDLHNPEQPHLFFEFHGFSEDSLQEQVAMVQGIAQDNGGSNFLFADKAEERSKLWQARHKAWYACLALKPGCRGYSTDVCVPISKLPEMVDFANQEIQRLGLVAPIVGHVGDGNFHCICAFMDDELEQVKELANSLSTRAIELEGTCTGEHGVGLGKRSMLQKELGDNTLHAMKLIKQAWDPNNIMNPTKVLL